MIRLKNNIIAGFEKCFPETGVNTYSGLYQAAVAHRPFANPYKEQG